MHCAGCLYGISARLCPLRERYFISGPCGYLAGKKEKEGGDVSMRTFREEQMEQNALSNSVPKFSRLHAAASCLWALYRRPCPPFRPYVMCRLCFPSSLATAAVASNTRASRVSVVMICPEEAERMDLSLQQSGPSAT